MERRKRPEKDIAGSSALAGVGPANSRNPERSRAERARWKAATCDLWFLQLAAIGGSVTMKQEGAVSSVV